jgi:hypothetical protein
MAVIVGVAPKAAKVEWEADSGMDLSPAAALPEPLKDAFKSKSSYN